MPVHIKRDGNTYLLVPQQEAHLCMGAVRSPASSLILGTPLKRLLPFSTQVGQYLLPPWKT